MPAMFQFLEENWSRVDPHMTSERERGRERRRGGEREEEREGERKGREGGRQREGEREPERQRTYVCRSEAGE